VSGCRTQTHALLAGSSAIDAADDCGKLIDQRGFGRDPPCDSGSYEFEGAPPVVSSAGGVTPQTARCRNITSGEMVSFVAIDWNCRGQGLAVASGDRVQQTVRGRPNSAQFTGTVGGIGNGRVLCQNLLTGQSIQFLLGSDTSFNCRERGLDFSSDKLISWTVTGIAD
jgi:hypothetical protein